MNTDYDQWFMKCVVCGTPKEHRKKGLQFFKFPREIERCRSWLKAIGKKELIYIYMEDLCELLVCSAHFHVACIDEKGNRLHRVGIPSITPHPALSQKVLAGYPKYRPKPPPVPVTHVFSVSEPADNTLEGEDATNQADTNSAIDFGLPLMNGLETLIHDEYHTIKKPAGILNSISVPLMTYSSSMENGTVFGVENPEKVFDLPFASLIDKSNDAYKPKTTRNMVSKTQKNANSTEHFQNGKTSKSAKNLTRMIDQQIKQYRNTKKLQSILKKSTPLMQNTGRTKNTHTTTLNTNSITGTVRVNKAVKQNRGSASLNTFETETEIIECDHQNSKDITCLVTKDNSISNKTEFTDETSEDDTKAVQNTADALNTSNTDDTSYSNITFVPYTQYEATVAPESTNAHIGEGTLDYGLPLMNCIGTIFQSNTQSTTKSKVNGQTGIDVPLMQCMKTLENSNIYKMQLKNTEGRYSSTLGPKQIAQIEGDVLVDD